MKIIGRRPRQVKAQRAETAPRSLTCAANFPYVNGRLFEEHLTVPSFNSAMRSQLLRLCSLSWGAISPAIFGAMFQKVMDLDAKARRRELGAHYTSETNILRLIGPLFLDELRAEFEVVKGNKNKLFEFHKKLQTLTFLDPACGCGNFLVVAYRELRRLELDVLRAAAAFGQRIGQVFTFLSVDVDQFFGIEIEEFPAQIAQVALWLTDHQMNVEAGEAFGEAILRIPLAGQERAHPAWQFAAHRLGGIRAAAAPIVHPRQSAVHRQAAPGREPEGRSRHRHTGRCRRRCAGLRGGLVHQSGSLPYRSAPYFWRHRDQSGRRPARVQGRAIRCRCPPRPGRLVRQRRFRRDRGPPRGALRLRVHQQHCPGRAGGRAVALAARPGPAHPSLRIAPSNGSTRHRGGRRCIA